MIALKSSGFESAQSGLICGFVFAPNSPGQPVAMAQACDWLKQVRDEDSSAFIWLHFDLAKTSTVKWMQSNLNLPETFYAALSDGSRSTRIEDAADQLIAVLNDVAFEFSFEPSEIATLWVCVNQHIIISARTEPLRSIDQLRVAVKAGERFNSSMALLIHLMHDQGDVLVQIVRDATSQVDSIEDNLLTGRLKTKRTDLGKLRRVLVRLQRLLAFEPAALFRFLHQPPQWIVAHDLDELRQSTEEFSLAIRDLAALQERIKLLQEEMSAQVQEQTNRSLFTLTIVTVLALPINIIAGLFGMNVGGIPLAENPHGFLKIIGLVVTFTLIASWLAFRKKDE
jgi:zinc transporter